MQPVGGADPDRLRWATRSGSASGPGLDAPVDRVFVRTAPDGEQVLRRSCVEVAPGPACRWLEVVTRADDAGDRLPVPASSAPTGHLLAQRAGPPPATRRPTATTSGSSPGSTRRRGSPTASSTRCSRTGSRTATRPTTSPTARGPTAASRHAGAAWARPAVRRPGRLGGVLRRRPGRRRGAGSTTSSTSASTRSTSTPIFDARSNHGYDTIDYGPRRGAPRRRRRAGLAAPRDRASADIRLILDIAPNHTGVEHPWFLAAQADPAAPTAGYYTFRAPARRLRVVAGRQVAAQARLPRRRACATRCTRARTRSCAAGCEPPFSIDGWRIDVANMLGPPGPGPARAGRRPGDARGRQGRRTPTRT